MAVQSELHRLPQDERKNLQILRQSVSEAAALAQLSGFVRIMRETAEKAMNLEVADSNEAFVIQGELKSVADRVQEIDQATTLVTQSIMMKVDTLLGELVTRPDGSRFPMFVKAMEFSHRTQFGFSLSFFHTCFPCPVPAG